MNKNMAHFFYKSPIYFRVFIPKFFCEHIYGLTNYFYKL